MPRFLDERHGIFTKTTMSDAPISEVEANSLEVLERSGWSNAELIWEQIQETAAERNTAGDVDEAAELWKGALDVAKRYFDQNDPRLATSLANHAVALRRAGDVNLAQSLFQRAVEIWSHTDDWIQGLCPEHQARSSTFHLRLQTKHPGGYDRFSLQRYQALVEEGRAAVQRLAAGEAGDLGRYARWRGEKPHRFTDSRKLLAAVLLLAVDIPRV